MVQRGAEMKSDYRDIIFFYMTGTGNSLRAARMAAGRVSEAGGSARVVSITEGKLAEIKEGDKSLVGLFYPTHAFTIPFKMLRFVLSLPRGRGAHAFVMPTRGSNKFGRVFLPGMEGTAGYLAALILLLKGYNLRGVLGLDMPSNWLAVHPGYPEPEARVIIERSGQKLAVFMDTLLAGGRYFRGFIALLLGIALFPLSLGYNVMGRFYLSKLFFPSYRCTGCGTCAAVCPNRAIRMRGQNRPRPYWTFFCNSCMRCMAYCPARAVEVGHSLAVIMYLATSVPGAFYLLRWLGGKFPLLAGMEQGWLFGLLNFAYTLFSLFITYYLFSLLVRIPLVNKFFTYTTFTRVFRRYHEPDTRISDLKN